MISTFIAALQNAGLQMTAEEIAEALWLSLHLTESEKVENAISSDDKMPRTRTDTSGSRSVPPTKSDPSGSLHLNKYSTNRASGSQSVSLQFRTPAASALPGSLALARALRPLKRRILSHTHRILDEQATIHRIAETNARFWTLVQRSAPVRRFDLALVIDDSESMALWRQTINELRMLLERQGAFREISLWRLVTGKAAEVEFHAGASLQMRHPRELLDPTGRRLILVITDCISPAWWSGKVREILDTWGQANALALIHMLPRRLWPRTALRNAELELVHAPAAGVANARLKLSQSPFFPTPRSLPVPVVTLEPHALASWAQMIMGVQDRWVPGALFHREIGEVTTDPAVSDPESSNLSPKERVKRFRSTASPTASKLAGLLAAAPVSLPIIRLIQQTMLPVAGQVHIAEIFLGGLLEEIAQSEESADPEYREYDFLPGVREELLNTVPMPDASRVIEEVSTFISHHYGQARDFFSWVAVPDSAREIPALPVVGRPFARIAATVWRKFGGEYAHLADQLEQKVKGILISEREMISPEKGIEIIEKAQQDRTSVGGFLSTSKEKEKQSPGIPEIPTDVEVFCSYAREDEALLKRLEANLGPLVHQGAISRWHDRQVMPGANWESEIDKHLNSATFVLLLISPAFLASPYCYGLEMKRAMQRHAAGEAVVIPILLRSCNWRTTPFAHLQALPKNAQPITSWSNQDEAFADVVAGIREALARLPPRKPSDTTGGLPQIWNLPFPRNPFFTGREEELARLREQLRRSSKAAIGQVQAISGLGGIGKTQLAVEYAYRYRQEYQAVLWVRADTLESLNASYSELARLLHLPEQGAMEQEVVVQAVRRWLSTQPGYLLIVDSLDEPAVLFPPDEQGQPRHPSPFLPSVSKGHILITTRNANLTAFGLGLAHSLAMPVFSPEQGAALVLTRAGRPTAGEPERATAEQLSHELGGLPLALEQAGAYLEATGMSLSDYLQLFRQRSHELLARRSGSDYPLAITTIWNLSFQRIEQRNPAAAELLRFCAFLAPDAIPEEILTEDARHLGKILAPVAADPLRLSDALAALRAYSLLTRDPEARTLTIHRLVQTILREYLTARTRTQWMRRVVLATNAAFPDIEFSNWPACERLLPHALQCATWIEQARLQTPEAARLLDRTGSYFHIRGRYVEAGPLLQRALAIWEQTVGPLHPDTAQSLNNLAMLHHAQGDDAQAEPLLQRALAIFEQALGPLHPDTATSLNNLAGLYRAQGDYARAEPLYQRSLAIWEQAVGPQHPDTAQSLNNLALLYHAQGKYEQAEPLYQRALAIRERGLGPQHPDTATSLYNVGILYQNQSKYAEAEPLLRRALAIYEQQLGPVHPFTQKLRESVAELLEQLNLQEEPNLFHIGDQDFEEKVLKSPLPVLVFFWGAWSGPCRALSLVFERISTRYNGQLRFAKLDVDEHQTIPARFGIQVIPTLLVFEEGKVTYRFVGPHPSELEDLIHRVLAHEDITEYEGGFFSPPPPLPEWG